MTAYIIACWGGDRRNSNPEYNEDRGYYIREHQRALDGIEHECEVFWYVNGDVPEDMAEALKAVTGTVVYRGNEGWSYGAWIQAFHDIYASHYIFVEDDNIPVLDNFDAKLVDMITRMRAGYLCQLFERNHAAVSGGIVTREAVEMVPSWLSHSVKDYEECEQEYQIRFHAQFLKSRVWDIASEYSTIYKHWAAGQPATYQKVGFGPVMFQPIGYEDTDLR